jgi:hypothetical protein
MVKPGVGVACKSSFLAAAMREVQMVWFMVEEMNQE